MKTFTLALSLLLSSLLTYAIPLKRTPPPLDFAVAPALSVRQSISDTENQLGSCAPITIIFARGTIEPGNVGELAGPPFFNALDTLVGDVNVAVQGVDYPATVAGYFAGGDDGGAATLAALTTQAAQECPDTQIVLSGYSQGAQVIHKGVAQIGADVAARIAAVVFFGDPDEGQTMPGIDEDIVDSYCYAIDEICHGLPIVDPAHLSYAGDAFAAAEFVEAHVSL